MNTNCNTKTIQIDPVSAFVDRIILQHSEHCVRDNIGFILSSAKEAAKITVNTITSTQDLKFDRKDYWEADPDREPHFCYYWFWTEVLEGIKTYKHE